MEPFADRAAAGRQIGAAIAQRLDDHEQPVVLALPRGGVPVAAEVARALCAPLDVLLVRKLGVPGHEELAFGALASGGQRVLNAEVVALAGLSSATIEAVAEREQRELERREERYRGGRPALEVAGRTVVLVDDGLATGATMRAAVQALRDRGAARIVVAVPVGSMHACELLSDEADALLCMVVPSSFRAVGSWYHDFSQVTDDDVAALLGNRSNRGTVGSTPPGRPPTAAT